MVSPDGFPEGAYLMMPSKEGGFAPQTYSKIDPDVSYEKGRVVEQWTIKYHDWKEYAIIRVRFSPLFKGLIEFEVDVNSIPIETFGRDVTVNWKFYDGFNANRTFYTDDNGLEMQERRIDFQPSYTFVSKANISSNFYPVASAISMRDTSNSNKEVVVLNDRTQAGTADLNEDSMIQLIQNRRLRQDDARGVDEALNERDASNNGIKVSAKYYLQIFDRVKGKSL
jgi:hypothetical protein